MLRVIREDRMVMTSRAVSLDKQRESDERIKNELYELLDQSQENTKQLMAENERLRREMDNQDLLNDPARDN